MKICEYCRQSCPDDANFCMACGNPLARNPDERRSGNGFTPHNWNLFWLTLGGSLFLSWMLMAVFHLPIFILGAILPLLWFSRKK